MKKNSYIILALIAIVIIVFVLRGTQDSSPSHGNPAVETVNSSDGRLSLEVKPETLPDGMSLDEISIQEGSSEDEEVTLAYDLGPDGAYFDDPIGFSLTLDGIVASPLIFHTFSLGGEEVKELIDELTIEVDEKENKTTVFGEIRHFSSIEVVPNHFATFTRHVPEIGFVGEAISVSGEVSVLEDYGAGGRPLTSNLTKSITVEGKA